MVLARINDRTLFFVGLSVGIAISLILLPIIEDSCFSSNDRPRKLRIPAQRSPLSDDYEPIINLQGSPEFNRAREVRNQQHIRPRYISSELGIREKLLIIVLSTQYSFRTHAGYLNKTISDEVKSVRFIVQLEHGSEGKDLTSKGVHVVNPTAIDQHFSLTALGIVAENYIKDYDFIFMVLDSTYIHVPKLVQLVQSFSISQNIHMGMKNKNTELNSMHCELNGGILLSHTLARMTAAKLEECGTSGQAEHIANAALSNCIFYVTNTPCHAKIQGKAFISQELLLTQYLPDWESIMNSTTLYPIQEGKQFLKIHELVCQNRLRKIYSDIDNGNVTGPWPLGLQTPFKPKNRFHVLTWTYFNQSYMLSTDNIKPVHTFESMPQHADLEDAIRSCKVWQANRHIPTSLELMNGYMRFDATRGMEYVLDFRTNISESFKRFVLFRPLSQSEMMPVPYVTEHTRVIILLHVTSKYISDAISFLKQYEKNCLEKQENTALVLILLYNATDPGKDSDNDIFKELKSVSLSYANKYRSTGAKLVWYSIRTLKSGLTEFAMLDLVIRKLPQTSLVLISQLGSTIDAEYLNRVRMNTISKNQVYFPIPFVQYNPIISDQASTDDFEIKKYAGLFDDEDYSHSSFYITDYLSSRHVVENEVPIIRAERDLRQTIYYENPSSLLKMFLKSRSFHILRAVEPQLKVTYRQRQCSLDTSDNCLAAFKRTLGAKSHLAKGLLLGKLKKISLTVPT